MLGQAQQYFSKRSKKAKAASSLQEIEETLDNADVFIEIDFVGPRERGDPGRPTTEERDR